jgi:chromosome segregation protein
MMEARMSENTTLSESNPFAHGAKWVRADFHLHTLKEMGASRKDYRAEFSGRETEFAAAFIKRLKEESIVVGVITNHNLFDLGEYQDLARKARKESILLLPGLELGIRGGGSSIHTLVVFDPTTLAQDNNFIENFLKGQFPRGNQKEGSATEDDLVGCLEKLEGLDVGYFAIFAHVDSSNGLLEVVNKTGLGPVYQQTKHIWNNRVLGFQKPKSDLDEKAHIEQIKQKLPDGMPIPAFVEGSDPEQSISEVGRKERGVCYLKISGLSFHSVQFALKDHVLRVRREEPVKIKRPVIQTLEIVGGKREFSAYQLSTDLNTLIGSRGSGKSLMIETLRWGLGRESGEGDKDYKKELIHAFLAKGASVKITGQNEFGDNVVITRAYTEKTNPASPQVYVSGKLSQLSVERVFPGLLYFGQKDLGARQENFYEQFFAQVLGTFPENLSETERRALSAFEKSIDNYLIAIKAKSEDDEHRYEQENLKKRLAVFQEHGVEQRLKEITSFDQDVRRFEKFRKLYLEKLQQLEAETIQWTEAVFKEDIFKSETNQLFLTELGKLQEEHEKSLALIQQGIGGFKVIQESIKKIGEKIDAKKRELQDQFAAILREIDHPDLNIDEYRKMVSRYEQLSEIRKLTAERGGRTALFERELIASGEAWHKAKKTITDFYQTRIDTVNAKLPANICIGIKFQGDKEDLRKFLEGIFRGSRFDEPSYEALLNACDSGLDLFKRKAQLKQSELSTRMGEIFEEKLATRFKDILTFSPKDGRTISYDQIPIKELSLGKRAMALLLLLLSLESHPIIILDQPEDDLDNETIHRLVMQPMLAKKESIQFIIATHNPNLPVLGDAEQVIACYEVKWNEFEQKTGSLDVASIKDAIISIMEGGQEAFDKRHDIYTLWKKSN